MLIGIDVRGTTTDAVLIEDSRVAKTFNTPTTYHNNLMKCLLGASDELVKDVQANKIERIALSTTLITNRIAEGKNDPIALIPIPVPGTNPADYDLGENVWNLDGAREFRVLLDKDSENYLAYEVRENLIPPDQ